MASISSSSSSSHLSYDVFLSFRGTDVRNSFLSHLYEALVEEGIKTFKDDEDLERGIEISPGLVNGIKESRLFVVVLSKEYASSPWCLDELQTILDCQKNCPELEIIPIFYHVHLSQVQHQTGSYGEALDQLSQQNFDHKILLWREALTQVAEWPGWPYQGYEPESKFIEKIVRDVSFRLNRMFMNVAEYPVGLDSNFQRLSSLLELQSNDHVRFIGIHGHAGIGKTTTAKHIYNSYAEQFEGHVFLSDIKDTLSKTPKNHGLAKFQKQLLRGILKDEYLKVENADMGINLIKERLRCKKVLVILDGVDNIEQLRKLAGSVDWFGPGSRILITTTKIELLIVHGVHYYYEVEMLNEHDSQRLMYWYDSKKSFSHIKTYEKMIYSATSWIADNPSELILMGETLSKVKRKTKNKVAKLKKMLAPHDDH